MPVSALDKTGNILQLYIHHLGESEVPRMFHLWGAISLIAACVADRVYLHKFRDRRLSPNLYVMLVGPSGLGKGEAIDSALAYVKNVKRVNVYRGKASGASLFDILGKPSWDNGHKRVLEASKVWFITPELRNSFGTGDMATAVITQLTDLYTGSTTEINDQTRKNGRVTVRDHCINWLAGTTLSWLTETVGMEDIIGGFFGRIAVVQAPYNLDKRVRRPVYPHDYEEITEHLHARIQQLIRVSGECAFTSDAEAVEQTWYETRSAPIDEQLLPAWKREHDLMLKLSMILSLADDVDLVIKKQHVVWAQQLTGGLMKALPGLLRAASPKTTEGKAFQYVRDSIKKSGAMQHSVLLRALSSRSYGDADALRTIVETLIQQREVVRDPSPVGAIYRWVGQKRMRATVDPE